MSASTPITQRDVAHACGLHPSTICLALKNSPSIPAETRRRVQAVAEELGYQPNVAARNLALLRTEKKSGGSLPIAWINQEARRDCWRTEPEARLHFESARRRAEEGGYHLEEIWTREPGMTAARVVQILRARGIEGVIFPAYRSFDFSLLNAGWSDFAMVGLNDLRLGEWLDVVCPDHYSNTAVALRELRALGYERVGLVVTPHFDAASSGLAHGCLLRHYAELTPGESVPAAVVPEDSEPARAMFREWFEEHRPEAVLGRDPALAEWARVSGMDTTWVQLHGPLAGFDGGIEPCDGGAAAAAVDCVIEKMRRFEKGVRESTRVHLVKGVWHEGRLARREVQPVVA